MGKKRSTDAAEGLVSLPEAAEGVQAPFESANETPLVVVRAGAENAAVDGQVEVREVGEVGEVEEVVERVNIPWARGIWYVVGTSNPTPALVSEGEEWIDESNFIHSQFLSRQVIVVLVVLVSFLRWKWRSGVWTLCFLLVLKAVVGFVEVDRERERRGGVGVIAGMKERGLQLVDTARV